MYVYQLTHEHEGSIKTIGYFGSWKNARSVMKKYRCSIEGFMNYPSNFKIRKIKVNQDNYFFLD